MGWLSQLGWLIIADANGCEADLEDRLGLELMSVRAVTEAGLRAYEHFVHSFPESTWGADGGVSALTLMVPLRESHLAIHTWGARKRVCLDLFTCGDREKALRAAEKVIQRFKPARVKWTVLPRGGDAVGDD